MNTLLNGRQIEINIKHHDGTILMNKNTERSYEFPTCGTTVTVIILNANLLPPQKIFSGTSFCGPTDCFSKFEGRRHALLKLIDKCPEYKQEFDKEERATIAELILQVKARASRRRKKRLKKLGLAPAAA